eukprot:8920148-Pyramimonas_sp.AAC.1
MDRDIVDPLRCFNCTWGGPRGRDARHLGEGGRDAKVLSRKESVKPGAIWILLLSPNWADSL